MERRRGRPRRADAKRSPLVVRLADDEKAGLKRIAALNQKTLTEFVREAIAEAVADCTDDIVLRPARA